MTDMAFADAPQQMPAPGGAMGDPQMQPMQGYGMPTNDPQAMVETVNLADYLPEEKLTAIGDLVGREYDIDKASRIDWERRIEDSMRLAMQVVEAKTFPWPGAANVKYPLMTTAAIQFNARAYPAIVQGRNVALARVNGADPTGQKRARAERISEHMSWQLTDDMPEWEEDTDKLLVIVPIVGCLFRKSWFDPSLGRNVSLLIKPDEFVVHYKTKSLDTTPRKTQAFELYPDEIAKRMRSGIWLDVDLGVPAEGGEDTAAPHWFLEQHRRYDLDEDGYPEPYIVTIHRETRKVVRITANYDLESIKMGRDKKTGQQQIVCIEPVQYFTKYGFIPSPDGGFYDVGFGALMGPVNKTVDTILNQLLDAGTLSNAGGGWIGAGVRMQSGNLQTMPGVWKRTDATGALLKDSIVPYPVKEPSPVLFQLLGLMIEAGKEISSVKDVLTGDSPQGANTPATTTLALIEQGLKVFTAIYKRIHRSLKAELKKLYRLNRLYMPPETYFRVLDEEKAIAQADYAQGDLDVTPVSDPTVVTDMQRLGRAQFMMQFVGDPDFDPRALKQRIFEAAGIDKIDELLAKQAPPPPPEAMLAAAKMKDMEAKAETDRATVAIAAYKAQAEIVHMAADTIFKLAQAEAQEAGTQIQAYVAEMQGLSQLVKAQGDATTAGGVRGMAPGRQDQGGSAVPGGLPPGPDGGMGAGAPADPGAGMDPNGPMPGVPGGFGPPMGGNGQPLQAGPTQ